MSTAVGPEFDGVDRELVSTAARTLVRAGTFHVQRLVGVEHPVCDALPPNWPIKT